MVKKLGEKGMCDDFTSLFFKNSFDEHLDLNQIKEAFLLYWIVQLTSAIYFFGSSN